MSIFSNLFLKSKSDESSILNSGLDMAMEFGEYFRQPIQSRLSKKYPSLTAEQLDQYNSMCTTAMESGFKFVDSILEPLATSNQTISEANLKKHLFHHMKANYPWINKDNLDRLYSQSCYFAFKNGWDQGIGK
jgi:hypothetical protein